MDAQTPKTNMVSVGEPDVQVRGMTASRGCSERGTGPNLGSTGRVTGTDGEAQSCQGREGRLWQLPSGNTYT